MHGRGMGTHGYGSRKKHKKSGHHGGGGMSGSGKRADHKKTLVQKLYGHDYFGKQGVTSRGTAKKKYKQVNLRDIEKNYDSLMKKHGKNEILHMERYRILGDGELKIKVKIKALGFSQSAKDKIEKNGGEAIVIKKTAIKESN